MGKFTRVFLQLIVVLKRNIQNKEFIFLSVVPNGSDLMSCNRIAKIIFLPALQSLSASHVAEKVLAHIHSFPHHGIFEFLRE